METLTTPQPSTDTERGSGTVLALAIIGALGLTMTVMQLVLALAVGTAQAQRTADLTALAAADSARGLNTLRACAAAEAVAQRNNATLTSCEDRSSTEGEADIHIQISHPVSVIGPEPQWEWLAIQRESRAGTPTTTEQFPG